MLNTKNAESAIQLYRSVLFRLGTARIFIIGIMLFAIARTDGGTAGDFSDRRNLIVPFFEVGARHSISIAELSQKMHRKFRVSLA